MGGGGSKKKTAAEPPKNNKPTPKIEQQETPPEPKVHRKCIVSRSFIMKISIAPPQGDYPRALPIPERLQRTAFR